MPVTVFEFNTANATSGQCEMARNVLKKAKTLMLPGILRTYAAVEHKGIIYIATEAAVPLRQVLHGSDSSGKSLFSYYYEDKGNVSSSDAISGERFSNAMAYGLKAITTGLAGIHQHGQVHGNVCEDSIFVTKGGEWRLFGLELVSGLSEEHSLFRRLGTGQMSEIRRLGVEGVFPQNGGDISSNPNLVSAVDSWALGCLIHRIYSSRATSSGGASSVVGGAKASEMRSFRGMPTTLQSCFMSLTGQNPKLRMTAAKFLESCEFINNCEYVTILNDLERLALLDGPDRDVCYKRLAEHADSFPQSACKHIVLQQLKKALTFGGGSATALEPILKMGSRLSPASFSKHVGPIVVAMYSSPDYLVRCRLLTEAGQYARLIPASLFNDKIFTSFASGFESRHADIRELTVRSLVHFAPLLSEARLTTDIPRYIQLLQQDREGPIRTNATVCLSLISQHIPEAIRGKTLVNGFGRMLKDPFVPSKLAALQSINNTMASYTAAQIAEQLLPAIAPITIEPRSAEVREAAIGAVEKMIAKLREAHKSMPEEEAATLSKPAATAEPGAAKASNPSGFFGSVITSQSPATPTSTQSPATQSTTAAPKPNTQQATTLAKWDDDDLDFFGDDNNAAGGKHPVASPVNGGGSSSYVDPSSGNASLNATTSSIQPTNRKPLSLGSTTTASAVRKPGSGAAAGGSLKLGGLSLAGTTPAGKRKVGLGGGLAKDD